MRVTDATGNPFARHGALVDVQRCVLLDDVTVVVLEAGEAKPDEPVVCIELAGRVNQQRARSDVLYLMDVDGAATLVAELIGVLARGRATIGPEFTAAVHKALDALPRPS